MLSKVLFLYLHLIQHLTQIPVQIQTHPLLEISLTTWDANQAEK